MVIKPLKLISKTLIKIITYHRIRIEIIKWNSSNERPLAFWKATHTTLKKYIQTNYEEFNAPKSAHKKKLQKQ